MTGRALATLLTLTCATASAAPPPPRPTAGPVAGFDAAAVQAAMERAAPQVSDCYDAALADRAAPTRCELLVAFSVVPDGSLKDLSVTVNGDATAAPKLRTCVSQAMAKLHLPAPNDGIWHQVRFPFHLGHDEAAPVKVASAPPPPPPPPPSTVAACEPKCRSGYACVKGKCVSACNPPCAAGETCTAEGECMSGNVKPAAKQSAAAPPPPPPAPAPAPAAAGTSRRPLGVSEGPQFDPTPIIAGVSQKQPEVRACYEASLADQTVNIEGTLETSFVVAVDGSVHSAFVLDDETTIYSPSVRACVAAVLSKLRFLPPADGQEHRIKVPFHLKAEASDSSDSSDSSEATRTPHTHVERRNLKPLWLTGLIADLGLWLIRGSITVATCSSASHGCDTIDLTSAVVPVIGGWFEVGKGSQVNTAGLGNVNLILLTFSSLLEAAGFVCFVTGLIVHHDVVVEDEAVSLWLGPGLNGRGVAFGGRF